MNGDSYERSIAKIALENIPTTSSALGGDLDPQIGPAQVWESLSREINVEDLPPMSPEETRQKAYEFAEAHLFSTGGITKLEGLAKLAKGLLPWAAKAAEGKTPYLPQLELVRVGNILRGAGRAPREDWARIHDVRVKPQAFFTKPTTSGVTNFPVEIGGIRKPSVTVSEEKAGFETMFHELSVHARQMAPKQSGGIFGIELKPIPKKQLSEADAADLLWRIRHKIPKDRYSYWADPVEISAYELQKKLGTLERSEFGSSKEFLNEWDQTYRKSLRDAVDYSYRTYPDIFEKAYRELIGSYPSKEWPIGQ